MSFNNTTVILSSDYAEAVPAPLAAIYESYLRQAVSTLGLSLDEALSNLPNVDHYLHVKDEVFASMRASDNKSSLVAVVETDGPVGECLPYLGTPTAYGYGPHRRNWIRFFGPVPDGLQIDHLCNNPLCQNVLHMIVTTGSLNGRRAHLSETCQNGHSFKDHRKKSHQCETCHHVAVVNRLEKIKDGEWEPTQGKATESECANQHPWTAETEYFRVRGERSYKECKVCRQEDRKRHRSKRVLQLV